MVALRVPTLYIYNIEIVTKGSIIKWNIHGGFKGATII